MKILQSSGWWPAVRRGEVLQTQTATICNYHHSLTAPELTKEQIMKKVFATFRERGLELIEFARKNFAKRGRGFVTLCLKNPPKGQQILFKKGHLYYTTEKENQRIEGNMVYKTEHDILLARHLSEYDFETDAVLMVWWATDNHVNKLSDLDASMAKNFPKNLPIH